MNTVTQAGSNIAKTVTQAGQTAANATTKAASSVISGAKQAITNGATKLANGVTSVTSAATHGIAQGINQAKTALTNGVNQVKTAVSNGVNQAKTALTNGVNQAKTALTNGVNQVKNGLIAGGVQAGLNALKGAYAAGTHLPAPVKDGIRQAYNGIVSSKNPTVQGVLNPSSPDKKYDGMLVGQGTPVSANTPLSKVNAVTPPGGPKNKDTIIYVNGIQTDVKTQQATLQAIANKTGSSVVGVHNSTQGVIPDVVQTAGDKNNTGRDPAATTLTNVMYNQLKAGQPVHVFAHSQGGAITSRALNDLHQRLLQENHGNEALTRQQMSHIRVDTFASVGTNYPDGPTYNHYINTADAFPMVIGMGNQGASQHPGANATFHYFTSANGPGGADLAKNHNIDNTYIPQYAG